jgi:hypothetical protein
VVYAGMLMAVLRSIQSLQFLLTLLAGWINRRQLEVIALKEENRLLKGASRRSTPSITDAERGFYHQGVRGTISADFLTAGHR